MLPIRWKLTLWYTVLLAITLSIFGFALYFSFKYTLMKEASNTVIIRAQQISTFIEIGDHGRHNEEGNFLDISDPSLPEKFSSEGVYIEIYDRYGHSINKSSNLKNLTLDKSFNQKNKKGLTYIQNLAELGPVIIYQKSLKKGDKLRGTIKVAKSLKFINESLDRLRKTLISVFLITLALSFGIGIRLAKAALDPIDWITKTARTIETGVLNKRLNWQGPVDEFGRLASAFDEMLDRLEKSFQKEHQFTADASHELRTPLTIIKGEAEVSLRGKNKKIEEYQRSLTSINEEVNRMFKIVNDLLTLARADSKSQQLEIEPVDLNNLIYKVKSQFESLAYRNKINFIFEEKEKILLQGDKQRLIQLLNNLIDNALKYTSPGGKVKIFIGREGEWTKMTVEDTGIGIPSEHLPHIFERFYRVDKARSRKMGGSGLGLSIVKWIVEAHKGRIEVKSKPEEGTRFTVWLPSS